MPMSNFALFLLFEVDAIFDLNEFPELGSDFIVISDFSSIYCFFREPDH